MSTVDAVYMLASGAESGSGKRSIATVVETSNDHDGKPQSFLLRETPPFPPSLPAKDWASYVSRRAGKMSKQALSSSTFAPFRIFTRDNLTPEITDLITAHEDWMLRTDTIWDDTLGRVVTHSNCMGVDQGDPFARGVYDYLAFFVADSMTLSSSDEATGDSTSDHFSVVVYKLRQNTAGLDHPLDKILRTNLKDSRLSVVIPESPLTKFAIPRNVVTVLAPPPSQLSDAESNSIVTVFDSMNGSRAFAVEKHPRLSSSSDQNERSPLHTRISKLRGFFTNDPTVRIYSCDNPEKAVSGIVPDCGGSRISIKKCETPFPNLTAVCRWRFHPHEPVAGSLGRYFAWVNKTLRVQTLGENRSLTPDELGEFPTSLDAYKVPKEHEAALQEIIDKRTGEYFLSRKGKNLTFIPDEDHRMITSPVPSQVKDSTTSLADV